MRPSHRLSIVRNTFLRTVLILSLVLFISERNGYSQKELDVISGTWLEYSDASNSLYHYLTGQAYSLLELRAQKVSEMNSLSSWQERQKYIKETLFDITGPFPKKTPLNAQIVRTITKDHYIIQNIIFESQPGFYVTSSLFIPAGLKKGVKSPAIIYCSGHSEEGYRNEVYVHVILNLVRKGFIVFAFDPVGQGERLEYFDPKTGKSGIGGPTKEHSYPGAQAFITGSSEAKYMIWDGIRAVDYLLTRKEIDPARLGITGRSGGGTQSAYIAAFDDRIYAAAPENYITNYTRLLQSIGPQDAEQNLFNLISRGLDHPDFLIVRAPKPAMMITTSNDMFNIQGAIETENEVKGIYKAYGNEENFSRVEDDTVHASTLKNREAMYAFFQKHLNNPGSPLDEEPQSLAPGDLQVTKTGQVSTSLKGETVFSLNRIIAEKDESKLDSSRLNPEIHLREVVRSAKKLSGYRAPVLNDKPVLTGRIRRNNYVIEKYFVKGEGGYVIPFLLFKPASSSGKGMIYLNPEGKSADAVAGGIIESFVNQGITVLASDLVGTGEIGNGLLKGDAYFNGVSYNLWYASMLIGRTIVGIQAADVIKLTMLLKHNFGIPQIFGCAKNEMCSVMLHAATFTSEFKSVILIRPYSSYRALVTDRSYNPLYIPGTVPGALMNYDLPDLAASLAPTKLIIYSVTDGNGNPGDSSEINRDIDIIRKSYKYHNAENEMILLKGELLDPGEIIRLAASSAH